MISLSLRVNGIVHQRRVRPNRLLVDFLHDDLGLIGARNGCGQGICGCCTILMDAVPVKACLVLAAQSDGATVETIEGLGSSDRLDRVQAAFVETGAVQCGFCIPGMIMTATALLRANPTPTEPEIRDALANNLCRCTGYVKIVEAVRRAASAVPGSAP